MSTSAREGTAQFGPYTVLAHLGEGGMCNVYRAHNGNRDFECALKVLKEAHRNDAQVRELFITEADVSMLLHHPNLMTAYDAGEIGGVDYIAMELIEGVTLGRLIKRCNEARVRLPPDFALFIVSEILEGLHSLHSASGKTGRPLGLIHRDITPHNIFLSFDGRVVLGDFGIAHIQAYGDTTPGEVLGKIGYLAPELIVGEEIDRRVDLFAVGIVLFELLTGTRLFASGSDEQLMQQIAEARVPRPRKLEPNLSRELEAMLMKALARKPRDRCETAEEMVYELEPFWSKKIGNPYALSAMLAALFRAEVAEWRSRGRSPSGLTGPLDPVM